MGVRIDKLIGVVLALIGISMLLLAADLAWIARIMWTPRAIFDVSLLSAVGIAAIAFGVKHVFAKRP